MVPLFGKLCPGFCTKRSGRVPEVIQISLSLFLMIREMYCKFDRLVFCEFVCSFYLKMHLTKGISA